MSPIFLPVAVLFPILGGALIPVLPFKNRRQMMIYTESIVLLNSVLALAILLNRPQDEFVLFRFTSNLTLSFKLDGLGTVFAGLISALWPLATLYAFEYMKHEEHEKFFFMFYTITFGITMGIALAEDLVTMYCFYEMLTLVTVPLVLHTLKREAILAGRTYLYYSLGGAAFAFIGVIFILVYGTTPNFVAGGVLDLEKIGSRTNLLLLIYVFCFFGFSVKAAMFPFSGWLPKAGVAPTPVTALLHAVAVVKAGAFATMRITYYSFGTEFLRGTWAQTAVMIPVIFTIVYGCSRALKETHLKRRLAWSTVSNLSYILFGVTLMTPLGLTAALTHMVCHAVIKICAFFCAGAVIVQSGNEYVYQLDGLGKKMPRVFAVFTISGMALMGVPGLAGFSSKWNLVKAALDSTHPLAVVGIVALLISALLTAIYMLTISVRAFCSPAQREASLNGRGDLPSSEARGCNLSSPALAGRHPTLRAGYSPREASLNERSDRDDVRDPGWMMMLPLAVFVVAMFAIGLHPQPLVNAFTQIASVMK
ncbi:MAG: proton-conducting membrane transporter [Clostridiales bacterium]|nr:proton-conducting membrane transporter [Clostridiales bacterium]MCC8065633.1 proton-conducting membrane transporter [Clostridiales bacterium]